MADPVELVVMAIEALHRGAWRAVAELVEPGELRAWFERQVTAPPRGPRHEFTVEEIRRHEPDMPEEVARYHAARANRLAAERTASPSRDFAGVETREELAQLEPAEALARRLHAQDPGWRMEERLKTLDPRLREVAREAWPRRTREAIGAVLEGEDRAHVVYRVAWRIGGPDGEGSRGESIQVASLRKTASGWRLCLSGELFHGGDEAMVVGRRASDEA